MLWLTVIVFVCFKLSVSRLDHDVRISGMLAAILITAVRIATRNMSAKLVNLCVYTRFKSTQLT